MKEQRPHLRHLDHIGELGEAGDGDDIMVRPALGPGRREPTAREMGAPLHKVRNQRGPEGMMGARPGSGTNMLCNLRQIPAPLWASMRRVGKMRWVFRLSDFSPHSCHRAPPPPLPEQQPQMLLVPDDIILE